MHRFRARRCYARGSSSAGTARSATSARASPLTTLFGPGGVGKTARTWVRSPRRSGARRRCGRGGDPARVAAVGRAVLRGRAHPLVDRTRRPGSSRRRSPDGLRAPLSLKRPVRGARDSVRRSRRARVFVRSRSGDSAKVPIELTLVVEPDQRGDVAWLRPAGEEPRTHPRRSDPLLQGAQSPDPHARDPRSRSATPDSSSSRPGWCGRSRARPR